MTRASFARGLKRMLLVALALAVLSVLLCVALAAFALHTLAPKPGSWSHTLRIGSANHAIERQVSVPALLRLATHPASLRVMDGRSMPSRFGRLQLHFEAEPGILRVDCAPCLLPVPELSPVPLRVSEAHWTLQRRWQDDWFGDIVLGSGKQALHGQWQAKLSGQALQLSVSLPPSPLADVYRLFADQVPELRRAALEGSAGLDLRLDLPSRQWQLKPLLIGARVAGLGTEALLGAQPPARCAAPAEARQRRAAAGMGVWLPRAVIAAEDQRFYEHPGYDLSESALAWQHDDSARAMRGASTISQQLAKLVFVGDGRDPGRKLRELLYALEMERTLGKARILQLYLAIAPWGQGQCGAEAAAWHYLGKPASTLGPVEAAWLASLLRNPDVLAQRVVDSGAIDEVRVTRIVGDLRPIGLAHREAAIAAVPGWLPLLALRSAPSAAP